MTRTMSLIGAPDSVSEAYYCRCAKCGVALAIMEGTLVGRPGSGSINPGRRQLSHQLLDR